MYSNLIRFSVLLLFVWGSDCSAALSDYFVSSDWLAKHHSTRIVDVRSSFDYQDSHIEEALNVPPEQFLENRGGVKSLVPTAEQFRALMGRLGLSGQSMVVAYAEDANPYAARFVWMLRYYGHQKAFVLDGGYEKWIQEKRATTNQPTTVPNPTEYQLSAGRDIRTEADSLLTRIGEPGRLVWDVRSRGEFQGSDVRAMRGGHIPGAVNLNWTDLQKEVNGVRVLRSEPELRSLLAQHGITPDMAIVAHCQTGIRSSYATLVLLGLDYPVVKNYDGSWTEWGNNPALPIEKPSRNDNLDKR